jgi:hypothetical protein
MPPEEKRCSSSNFSLLASIHRLTSCRKPACLAITNLDEYQAVLVAHDQVNFADPATEISGYEGQAAGLQMIERQLFGAQP